MINAMHELKDQLSEQLNLGMKNIQSLSDDELMIMGRDDKMLEVLEYLATSCNARLVNQVVNDLGTRMELIDVLFMNHLRTRAYVKIDIDTRDKKLTSVTDLYPSAKWLEKYQSQFLEINFQQLQVHETDKPLVSRKDASLPWINIQLDDFIDKSRLPGKPGLFDPKLDLVSYTWAKSHQNVITSTRSQLGHFHRGIIKMGESLSIDDLPFMLGRLCWREKFHLATVVAYAIERLNNMEKQVPPHAQLWRIFACELERVKNHHEFLECWLELAGHHDLVKENKQILEGLEPVEVILFSDQTKTPFIVPGGVLYDPVATGMMARPAIEAYLHDYEKSFNEFLLTPMWEQDLFKEFAGIGKFDATAALAAGLSGPSLRACGLPFDARADFPSGPFKQGLLRWDMCTSNDGDARARIEIHAHEIVQSLRIMYQVLSLLAETPVAEASRVDLGTLDASAEAFAIIESARGELHAYTKATKDGTRLNTLRIGTPSYLNFTAIESLVGSTHLRKFPFIVQSIDPCWACIDL
ncbi:MAG TPA: NADH-quinone oxidoreductase subunit C [Candidatus Lokiarchaeia archaeon]|nr:NADH-quinone oxidoreductase subunit C [Candidatus Lokiarchaeia archaeon]